MKKEHKLYEVIEGDELLTISEQYMEPIVDGILYPNDYVMITAEEKVGKTIFAQQLACSLTSATPLLGIFDIPKPVNVWYFATEGRTVDLKDRFIRMNHGIPLNIARLKLIPTHFRFNTSEGTASLKEILETYQDDLPNVIIVDALYRAIKGSISKDDVVNEFHHVMGLLQEECDCAMVLVHHLNKAFKDDKGNFKTSRSDRDTYGSAFLLAGVDHCFRLEKIHNNHDAKNERMLYCDTQRSSKIPPKIHLRLVGPDPLFFTMLSIHAEERRRIITLLKTVKQLSVEEIVFKSNITRSTVYVVLKELLDENMIIRTGTKTKSYELI